MDMRVDTSELKGAKDEPSVTNNSVMKVPGHFKLFKFGKEFVKNLDVTYKRACMESTMGKYWS